jgi:hypothetical protein
MPHYSNPNGTTSKTSKFHENFEHIATRGEVFDPHRSGRRQAASAVRRGATFDDFVPRKNMSTMDYLNDAGKEKQRRKLSSKAKSLATKLSFKK